MQLEEVRGMVEMKKSQPTSVQGFTGWLIAVVKSMNQARWQSRCKNAKRQMHIEESLLLGSKRQLLLITCGGERFLVGTGSECVQTIVRIGPESSNEHNGLVKAGE